MLEINLLVMYLIAIGIVAMVVILVIRVCGLELTWYILATLTFLFATIGGVNMWDDHRTDWISLVVSFDTPPAHATIGWRYRLPCHHLGYNPVVWKAISAAPQ